MAMTVVGVLASDRGSTSVPALAADTTPDEQVSANSIGVATRYVPISPIRVLDTRTDPGRRRLGAGRSLSLAPVTQAVAAATGVAPGAVQAVVLNLTMVDVDGAGYASIWPTGSPMPTVSSANTDLADQTVANMVTVPLGVDGFISIFSSIGADYIVDVQGVYEGRDQRLGRPFRAAHPTAGDRHAAGRPRSHRTRRSPSTWRPSGCPATRRRPCST